MKRWCFTPEALKAHGYQTDPDQVCIYFAEMAGGVIGMWSRSRALFVESWQSGSKLDRELDDYMRAGIYARFCVDRFPWEEAPGPSTWRCFASQQCAGHDGKRGRENDVGHVCYLCGCREGQAL